MLEKTMGNFTSNRFVTLDKSQLIINALLAAKDDVKEILSVDVEPQVTSFEPLNGEALVSGRVNVKVLTKDAEGALNSLNYNADFSDRYKNELIEPSSSLTFEADVVDANAAVENGAIKVEIVADLNGTLAETAQNSCLSRAEGIYVKEDVITVGRVAATLADNFTVSGEAEVKYGIEKVLLAQSDVCLAHAEARDNVLTLEGDCALVLTYIAVGGGLKSQLIKIPFREEVNAEGFSGEGEINVFCRVRNTRIHLDVLEDAENNIFTAEINIAVRAQNIVEEDEDVICDAYSATHELELSFCRVASTVSYGMTAATFNSAGEISVPGDAEITGFCGLKAAVTSVRPLDGKLTLEGVLTGTLLASGGGDAAYPFAVPFVHTVENDDITENLVVRADAAVTEFEYRQGRNVNMNFTVCVSANLYRNIEENCVADAVEGEELSETMGAIEVCIAKAGETLWQIAKSLRMSKEDIRAANPELVTPLEKDEKLVVYHCIAKD